MSTQFQVSAYQNTDQPLIRAILERIGWDERYIQAFEQAAVNFAGSQNSAVFLARRSGAAAAFVFIECHTWNHLAQIQGLAVDPACQRQGAASALVTQAEAFAHARGCRGIYVDTPTANTGGRRFYEAIGYQLGYIMPRYYEDALDGVTYQKFF